jgi:hypothetical protein
MEHPREIDTRPAGDRERGPRSVRLPPNRTLEVGSVNAALRGEGAQGIGVRVAETVAHSARNGGVLRADGGDESRR